MNIEAFGKVNANMIAEEAAKLLAPLEQKYGINVRAAGGTFDVDKFVAKFEFRVASDDAQKRAFANVCEIYGAKAEDFGKEAVINGDRVKLVGFNKSRPQKCIRLVRVRDGRELVGRSGVLIHFGIKPVEIEQY